MDERVKEIAKDLLAIRERGRLDWGDNDRMLDWLASEISADEANGDYEWTKKKGSK